MFAHTGRSGAITRLYIIHRVTKVAQRSNTEPHRAPLGLSLCTSCGGLRQSVVLRTEGRDESFEEENEP
jgi:hypothetical protein